ncbi:MAG: FAD binding domain-containing protein [Desulfovibrio sp.]|jgi:carbon-monoxide dehydrogenase medium subunit|nr:FAD binding domain-containing protein [Desulfovibrio sp.]
MTAQTFYNPASIAELLDVLDKFKEKVVIVNGGTDVVERLQTGRVAPPPDAIMYIRNVAELDYIREENGHVAVGGITSYAEMLSSPLCRQFGGLMQALAEIGSPPIRTIATPAGNIGTAAPAADCNAALMALGASVVLASKTGERALSFEELFSGPQKTCLRRDELIREIRIPVNKTATSAFIKLAKRKAQDIAQVSACVCLEAEGDVCKNVVVSLGAVAPVTVRARSMEALIVNKTVDDAVAAVRGFVPSEASLRSPRNKAYKEAVIGVIVGRAIKKAHAETAGRK